MHPVSVSLFQVGRLGSISFDFQREGDVRVNGRLYQAHTFKTLQGPNAEEFLVYVAGSCFNPSTVSWRGLVFFTGHAGTYAGFDCDVERDSRFKTVESLDGHDMEAICWWVKPGFSVPSASIERVPGESEYYPASKVYEAMDSVMIPKRDGSGLSTRGCVHSSYKRPDGKRVYHIYTVTPPESVPEYANPDSPPRACYPSTCMGVYTEDEVLPPLIKFKKLDPAKVWWNANWQHYEESEVFKQDFLYWPAPEGGWKPGHLVSVPDEYRPHSFLPRSPARVEEYVSTKDGGGVRVSVVYPKIGEFPSSMENPFFEHLPVKDLLGLPVSWRNPDRYEFHSRMPSTPVIAPRIRTPSLAESPPPELDLPRPAKRARTTMECDISAFFRTDMEG
jgi:hypothetical protein